MTDLIKQIKQVTAKLSKSIDHTTEVSEHMMKSCDMAEVLLCLIVTLVIRSVVWSSFLNRTRLDSSLQMLIV